MHDTFAVSGLGGCHVAQFSRATWYRRFRRDDQAALRSRIHAWAHARPRVDFTRIWVLLRREGWPVKKTGVRRWSHVEGLQRRMQVRRRKDIAWYRGPAPAPAGPSERWRMDVVHDALADGRPFRVLTVVEQWSRQRPIREVAARMCGRTVGEVLDRALVGGPSPTSLTVEQGTEFMSRAREDWAFARGVQFDFIRPGKPGEHAVIESFHGQLRDDGLNVHPFTSHADAQATFDAWRIDSNHLRRHGALSHRTPDEYARQGPLPPTAEVASGSRNLSRSGANVRARRRRPSIVYPPGDPTTS
jgi:putative transposase